MRILAALLVVGLGSPAHADAIAQLRGAAADHRAGATSYDGGYAGEDAAPVEGGAPTGRAALSAPNPAEPAAATKEKAEVPGPDCPPCPEKPWYKKPFALGAVGAGVGAAIGILTAPVGFGLLFPAIMGAAIGFGAVYAVSKFARDKGWL